MDLQKAIESSLFEVVAPVNTNQLAADFEIYDTQCQNTEKLEVLYSALMTIKPTSVESERTFSVSGNFAIKIRSRLNDNTLTAFVCLKRSFQEQKKQKNE